MKRKGGKTLKIFSAFVVAAGDVTLGFVDVGHVLYHWVTATAEQRVSMQREQLPWHIAYEKWFSVIIIHASKWAGCVTLSVRSTGVLISFVDKKRHTKPKYGNFQTGWIRVLNTHKHSERKWSSVFQSKLMSLIKKQVVILKPCWKMLKAALFRQTDELSF